MMSRIRSILSTAEADFMTDIRLRFNFTIALFGIIMIAVMLVAHAAGLEETPSYLVAVRVAMFFVGLAFLFTFQFQRFIHLTTDILL